MVPNVPTAGDTPSDRHADDTDSGGLKPHHHVWASAGSSTPRTVVVQVEADHLYCRVALTIDEARTLAHSILVVAARADNGGRK